LSRIHHWQDAILVYRHTTVREGGTEVARRVRRTWPVVVIGLVALVVVGGVVALQPYITPLSWAIRTCALLGYLFVFLAVITSAYMREMVRMFGRPFVQVHHMLSVTGLVLVTLHPLGVAWDYGSPAVFVPLLDSWLVFLRMGGRPAWYLIAAASLAAVLRTSFRDRWRAVHMLNYLAFFLATGHALLVGTDFRSLISKVLAVAMALAVAGALIRKRFQRRRLQARRR
jgi:sulfoxide reductase heme-binding subunit YedZ